RVGWQDTGENLEEGTYQIESARTGTALELAVEGVPVGGPRGRGARGGFGGPPGAGRGAGPGGRGAGPGAPPPPPPAPIPPQTPEQVAGNWPSGPVAVRLSPYMSQAQPKRRFPPVPDAGGHPGPPDFRIKSAATGRTRAR